jgi:hypothetical protein
MAIGLLHETRRRKTLMHRILGVLLLGATLASPVILKAEEHPRRYYDRGGRDWHEWNEREERAYRHYLEEKRWEYRAWERRKRAEQAEYWRWRHGHPDAILFR